MYYFSVKKEIETRYKERFESSKDFITRRPASYVDITFMSLKLVLSTKDFHINDQSFAINYNLLMENGKYNQLAELLSNRNNLLKKEYIKREGSNKVGVWKVIK